MQIKLTVLLSCISLARASFELPADLADGAYHLTYDVDNNTVISNINTGATSIVKARSAELAKRDSGCTGSSYNHDSYLDAVRQLKNYCNIGNWVSPGAAVFASGDAKVYVCNYRGAQPCSSGEWDDFNSQMDRNCGAWVGAWVCIPVVFSKQLKFYSLTNSFQGLYQRLGEDIVRISRPRQQILMIMLTLKIVDVIM